MRRRPATTERAGWDDALAEAAAGSHRTEANAARDGARHPAETLNFLGARRTVLEDLYGSVEYKSHLATVMVKRAVLAAIADG